MSILQAIGNTTLVRLQKVVPENCADVFVKLEWENPTGSMKDRMALSVIAKAEADGRLQRGDTVIEYTGGSTGASLALVCAARGYPIHIVSSDAFSREKLDQMRALGARLTLVPAWLASRAALAAHAWVSRRSPPDGSPVSRIRSTSTRLPRGSGPRASAGTKQDSAEHGRTRGRPRTA